MSSDRMSAERDSIRRDCLHFSETYAIYLWNISTEKLLGFAFSFVQAKLLDATIFHQNFATIENPIKFRTDSIFLQEKEIMMAK